jgi:hypothetical protein
MSSFAKAWKSSPPGHKEWRGASVIPVLLAGLVLLAELALLAACTPASPAEPAPTPTGPLISEAQVIEMGLSICTSSQVTSAAEPALESAELTTNQAIAGLLGRPPWPSLPADSPIWLVKFSGAFSVARSPSGGSATAQPAGLFPACWAIIEARTGARGTVYIPEK